MISRTIIVPGNPIDTEHGRAFERVALQQPAGALYASIPISIQAYVRSRSLRNHLPNN